MRNLLLGEHVQITSIKEKDLPFIEEWFNDIGFLRNYDMLLAKPHTYQDIRDLLKWFDESNERFIFAIRDTMTGQIAGVAGFDEIIWSNGTAVVFIGIGDKSYLGRGIGREAMNLIVDYGFSEMNFFRIHLNVISYNQTAVKLYESLGFVREGIYRDFIYRDGKRHDMYLYGLLRTEWEGQSSQ